MVSDPWFLLIVTGTFIVAGMLKGAVGVGLPTVAIAVLAATFGLQKAVPIILIPAIVTNLWQGGTGGYFRYVLQRIWAFLLFTTVTIFLGVELGTRVDSSALQLFLGLSLCAYAMISLSGKVMSVPHERAGLIGAGFGCVNGLLTGLTGSFVFPGIPFIKAIGMPRAASIQAMGIYMTMASTTLAIALLLQDRLSADLGMVSALAVVPAMAGMFIGRRLRNHLSEAAFNRSFLSCMLLMGLYISISAAKTG